MLTNYLTSDLRPIKCSTSNTTNFFFCLTFCPRHALNLDHCLLQGHTHAPETRGLCLSEEQTITTVCTMSISRSLNLCLFINWFITSSHNLFKDLHTWKLKLQGSLYAVVPSTSIDLLILSWFQLQVLGNHADGYGGYPLHHNTEIRKLTRHCEVTAILVLYGLPRWVIIHQLPISLHLYSSHVQTLQTLHIATLVLYCVGREVVLTTT